MADITQRELSKLAAIIVEEIEQEFSDKHLSGNLLNTIKVTAVSDNIQIEIPAPVYNFYQYFINRVVIPHTGGESYASALDETGSEFTAYYPSGRGFRKYHVAPHNHTDWVNRVIDKAIERWTMQLEVESKMTGKVTKI